MSDESDCDTIDYSESNELEGWTKGDKFDLLQGIKRFGSNDIGSISKLLPLKTVLEIRNAVEFYKDRALKKYYARKEVSKRSKHSVVRVAKSSVPLSNWASTLLDNFGADQLQTETVTAVRMIADCEVRPEPTATENFDFAKAYHLLADAMEGKTIKVDKNLEMLVNHCMHETATYSRSFIKKNVLKSVLDKSLQSEEEVHRFPQSSPDAEAATVSHLAAQKNYNPLQIPEDYMKARKFDDLVDN